MLLPCIHSELTVEQINQTIDLLRNLHSLHPEVLEAHNISPNSYIDGLVFRSAVESIRGTYIASSQASREAMIGNFLRVMKDRDIIYDYQYTGRGKRCDYNVDVAENYQVGLEVKGGEGNSIQISDKPEGAEEFGIWSHLDGSIQNSPSSGAHKVIGRILNEMGKEKKRVDVLFIRDRLCNTTIRQCPKYSETDSMSSLGVAPDIFLFPSELVTARNPTPVMHTLDSLKLPKLVLQLFEVPEEKWSNHIWEVRISLARAENQIELDESTASNRMTRTATIWHKGIQVDRFRPQTQ